MKKLLHIIILLSLALGAQAQAIQSINERNMKFEKGLKPDPIKVKPTIDYSIPIDTTTAYYAFVDSAQHYINAKQWNRA